MKSSLKYMILALVTISISLTISSCSNEEVMTYNVPDDYFSPPLYLKCTSSIEDADPKIVTLTQYTRENPCEPNSMAIVKSKSSKYTLYIRGLATPGEWKVYSGSGITFDNGSLTASGTTVTVHFASDFKSGSIMAVGNSISGETWGPILNFSKP
ncbi:hypothetical protein [Flavobacterium phragmitis]|uniref:Lipoprotein n=1 Tax=Flavobacterium phragmitis TaxID=739143 RepID=A0A1I1LX19_9FLAO|nr:hypothetical protein [Flavobacterium phragmitis]SFC77525.1 hypothetical protein SAMN05216297_102234 [Flavobacterium phragmitis]